MKIKFIKKLNVQILLAAYTTIAGDYLFFDQHLGANLATFQGILLLLATTRIPLKKLLPIHLLTLLLSFLLILSNLYEPSLLATALFIPQTLFLFKSLQYPQIRSTVFFRDYVLSYFKHLPFRVFNDFSSSRKREFNLNKAGGAPATFSAKMAAWIIPLGISSIFLILFSIANPLIEKYFLALPIELLEKIQLPRLFFWCFLFCLAYGVARARGKVKSKRVYIDSALPNFNDRIILRCLFLFNIVFFLENITDIIFLFSGKKLPDGISFAEYAHRGAYPLIFTTIIAGIFVLIVFNESREKSKVRNIYNFLYLWIAQNIFLLFSSAVRLFRYIEEYSLTELRLATIIWLVLVAIGFLLMTVRIVKGLPNNWLIDQTAKALYFTLFVCCFVNFEAEIAVFNVNHSNVMESSEKGLDLEILNGYKYNLIPALSIACNGSPSEIKRAYFCELLNRELDDNKRVLEQRGWRGSSVVRILLNEKVRISNQSLNQFKKTYNLKNYSGFNYCSKIDDNLQNFYGLANYKEQMDLAKNNQNNLLLYNLIYIRHFDNYSNCFRHTCYQKIEEGRPTSAEAWLSYMQATVAPKHPIYEIMSLRNSDREYALGLAFHTGELKNQFCFEILCRSSTCRNLLYGSCY